MHIAPFDNQNKPIVDIDDSTVPLNYFNIVKLKKGEAFEYEVPGYETCIVPATGSIDVNVEGFKADDLGGRGEDVWDGEPEGVYVPTAAKAEIVCTSDDVEVFIAGARYDKVLDAFAVRNDELDLVQYGSDDTKTHRKIKHILGTKYHDSNTPLALIIIPLALGPPTNRNPPRRNLQLPLQTEPRVGRANAATRRQRAGRRLSHRRWLNDLP